MALHTNYHITQKNAFFMNHWGKWATIFILGTPHYRSWSCYFFISFFQGNVLATTSCDRSRIRRMEASEFSCFNTSRAAWRGGQGSATWKPCHSPFIALPQPWKQDLFSRVKNTWFLSLIFLYLLEPVIENRAMRRLRAVGLECLPGKTYKVYKGLLIIFSCFLLYLQFWWAITFDKQQRKPCLAVSDTAYTLPHGCW